MMLLWLAFAVMTAATLAVVLRPLGSRAASAPAAESADPGTLAVYRDQLNEIEAQRAQGILEATEAEAARIEISRRLLAAAEAKSAAEKASGWARTIMLPIAATVPLLTLVVYLVYGSPGMPGQPHAAVMAAKPQTAQIAELVARVESRLREAPQDGKGWDVIAPVYFKLGRFADAQNAYQQATRILGESVQRLAGFAEATVFASDGIVTEDARRAYARILELEPGRIEARFWLALAREQDGDLAGAKSEYDKLVAEASPDAPWRHAVEERSRTVAARLASPGGAEPRGTPAPGPSADDVAAAGRMDPAARQRMIEGMVDGLAQRLKKDGRDLAGWQRLVRAYAVLQRTEEAKAALAEARKIFAGDAAATAELSRLAASVGLGS